MDVKKVLAKFDELIDEAAKVRAEREANVARKGESIVSSVDYYRVFSSTIALLTYLQARTYVDLVHSVNQNQNPNIGSLREFWNQKGKRKEKEKGSKRKGVKRGQVCF